MAALIPLHLGFRVKLTLAMMLVVLCATGGTLYVAQDRLTGAQQRLFEERFGSLRTLEETRQAARLHEIAGKSFRQVRTIRTQALIRRCNDAIEKHDVDDLSTASDKLYQVAEDEFRDVLNTSNARPDAPLAAFFRFVDGHGGTIAPPPGVEVGRFNAAEEARIGELLRGVFRQQAGRSEPGVGYLAATLRTGRTTLLEVVFTPILDPIDGGVLGALALSFASPLTQAAASNTVGEIHGLWLEGTLHAGELGERARQSLIERLKAGPSEDPREGSLQLSLEGHPYRVLQARAPAAPGFPEARFISLFPLDEAIAERRALRRQIAEYAVAALVVALALSLALAHGLSVPLRELVRGTSEVQAGNLEVRVRARSRDELGQLAVSFNDMTAGLALKEKYRSILGLVADKGIADELIKGRVALGGEQRDVSVLFCDIRGFTALTQGMPPAEVIRLLNEHFTPLTRVVYEHEGVVDKFVGDLIMAIFGAPRTTGRDAEQAAACALKMIAARRLLNESSDHQISIGIGVASGPALAGCMGSADRLNYTVLGERINLASRLCSQAGRMEVVIDQTTLDQIQKTSVTEPLPPMKLKGFSEPVQAHRLLSMQVTAAS